MRITYSVIDILRGMIIYAAGDTTAAIILQQFSWPRTFGMILVGATFYAFEIPNYFRWIDRSTKQLSPWRTAGRRTLLALLYFNPLWIARHLFFIFLFSGRYEAITGQIFGIALKSFLVNIPISLTGNYIIQNKIALKHRFFASATFSALMAIYYALSEVIFS